jgi:hypothetical protein
MDKEAAGIGVKQTDYVPMTSIVEANRGSGLAASVGQRDGRLSCSRPGLPDAPSDRVE